MSAVRLVVSLVAAAILVAPGALAASASGEFEAGGITLPVGGSLTSLGADLVHDGDAAPELVIEGTDVAIQRVGYLGAQVGTLYWHEVDTINERESFSSARITLTDGPDAHFVALRSLGPVSATLGSAGMRAVAGQILASPEEGRCDASADRSLCIEVAGVHELMGSVDATFGGELLMIVRGDTVEVAGDGRTLSFASGERTADDGVQTEVTLVIVRAKSASGTIASPGASLFSTAPTIATTEAAVEAAEGVVRVGARDYRASDDRVIARGQLTLTPGVVPPATIDEYGAGPVYASSFTTRISGDVQSINLNAAPAFLDSNAERGILAAVLGLALAGVAYAWQHITFFAAAMYTRLNKPDILDNDVRNRIYDIIRENPGISAREVHRRSEQSWGTVVYHLRQLERHHLVVSRRLGRTRNYYENHGKYRGMEVQLACLQSDRARVLARAIATQPGITQEQLAAASGYPQPTTSYYVRKLKQAGLVEEQREGRYVKYVPHADLPRFIAMSDSAPATNATAPSGVQA